jgi:hypothetical protein
MSSAIVPFERKSNPKKDKMDKAKKKKTKMDAKEAAKKKAKPSEPSKPAMRPNMNAIFGGSAPQGLPGGSMGMPSAAQGQGNF